MKVTQCGGTEDENAIWGQGTPPPPPRLCSDSGSDSASEVHDTPFCTLQRRTHNLLPFGASTQAHAAAANALRVSGCNYPPEIKPTNTQIEFA